MLTWDLSETPSCINTSHRLERPGSGGPLEGGIRGVWGTSVGCSITFSLPLWRYSTDWFLDPSFYAWQVYHLGTVTNISVSGSQPWLKLESPKELLKHTNAWALLSRDSYLIGLEQDLDIRVVLFFFFL